MSLEGRVALVTGAAGHVGRVFAETLAELGARVVILDLDASGCADVATSLEDSWGVDAMPCPLDLADPKAVGSVPGQVLERFSQLDILVHCAALVGTASMEGWATDFEGQSMAHWPDALQVNLTAPVALTQACANSLKLSGHGSVINVGSHLGIVGPDWQIYEGSNFSTPAAYAASKGGLVQMTRWLATTLAPDVRVNAISPGGIRRDQQDSFIDKYSQRTPLGRMANEDDLRGALAFLASDLSAYVTGQNLIVDGGYTAW